MNPTTLPRLARALSVPPSDSVPRGTGEPAARPAGAEPPSGFGGMLRSLLAPSIGQLAENAWRSSNREQLHAVALRAAEIDPEKALAAATLLAFAAGGKEPEVPTLRPGSLGWLFVASLRDLQAFGPAAVGVSPSAARALWVGLSEALEAHDKASQGRSDRA